MFRFRFARLLKYRRRIVDDRARAVKEATEVLEAARDREKTVLQNILKLTRQCASSREQAPSVEQNRQQADFLQAWRADLETLRHRCAEAEQGVATAQADLVVAYRDQEVLEQLQRRQREAWEADQRRRERKLLDEIGSIRAVLKPEFR